MKRQSKGMKLCTKSDKYFLLSRSLQGDQQTHNASEGREREHTDCYYLDVWDLDNVSSPAYVQCIATHFIAKSMWWNFESTTINAEYHISQHIIRHAIWTNIVCMTFDWFGMVGGRKKVAYLLCLFWNSSQSIDKVCIVELLVRKFTRTKQPFVILFSCFNGSDSFLEIITVEFWVWLPGTRWINANWPASSEQNTKFHCHRGETIVTPLTIHIVMNNNASCGVGNYHLHTHTIHLNKHVAFNITQVSATEQTYLQQTKNWI